MSTEVPTVDATVRTDRTARYGKQLVSHLGRRNGGEWSADAGSGWIDLGAGRATVTAGDGVLDLHLRAPADELARLQDVIASHLTRFGERDELSVEWIAGQR
ncbi:DUF2218 domain-containing protein [Mycobacterium sp. CVI_P3]|uniref:DUF2218 domain-containing protein n=1 Tax=Mycobacterium pinniadriaticum TaxID=2994102 RepID=A0ABT3S7I5_9MYCO|nr:DUF2218 domain-containing protein [Mycobacterium pinniadriaticum]MCX2929005.1 DUF2218 domain-containing protein [Mycobacterium pinniadriaticum]MCX2935128.1 DUF2218 domain-containing protein [Mycobacterium pinniadriaticum]